MRWPSPRAAAIAAMLGAAILLLFAPLHAAAYFNTPDGSEDLFAYQAAGGRWIRETIPSAYGFAEPYEVYLTWGKLTSIGIALLGVGFLALHGTRDATMTKGRRTLGRAACVAWVALGLAALLEYFTPFTDIIFLVAVPSLLATVVLTAIYGIQHARARTWPRWVGASLAAGALLFVPLVVLFGHIPMGSWGWAIAWLALGPWLAKGAPG